jgi:hypothetical protein
MMSPHDPVNFPTDPHPVRPGTSAALTAKTIDATVYPPIVQAREAVAELIPRLAVPLSSPLFATTLAGTLVFVWLAMRARTRLAPVLLSAMLTMTLTSFRPAGIPDEAGSSGETQVVDEEVDEDDECPERFERREAPPPIPEPPSFEIQIPEPPGNLKREIEGIMQDEELREAIEELRERIEEELRRREGHSHDENHFLSAQLLA